MCDASVGWAKSPARGRNRGTPPERFCPRGPAWEVGRRGQNRSGAVPRRKITSGDFAHPTADGAGTLTSCAAAGQEAADENRAVADVVPDQRIADPVRLLDHGAVRHREPLAADHDAIRILSNIPVDFIGPKTVGRGAAP